MVTEVEFDGAIVLDVARGWLERRRDPYTRHNLDDCVQEAALRAWCARLTLRERDRLGAFTRTIAQRTRFHALRRYHRLPIAELDCEQEVVDPATDSTSPERMFRIGDSWVDAEWLLAELRESLAGLGSSQREVLEAFYSGSSCRDIGGRYGLSEGCVKQRLFRARMRVREDLEARARCAGLVDVAPTERTAARSAEREEVR